MSKEKNTEKKRLSQTRRNFLLTFFDDAAGYDEKEVNGYWLVKSWNGDSKFWQVAIYEKGAFERYKAYWLNQQSLGV